MSEYEKACGYEVEIRIANRSDAQYIFDKVMEKLDANGDINWPVETDYGEGTVYECLLALKKAFDRGII